MKESENIKIHEDETKERGGGRGIFFAVMIFILIPWSLIFILGKMRLKAFCDSYWIVEVNVLFFSFIPLVDALVY